MEKLITETNFTTINYDSNSEFIRSDLKIVKKKDWNDRGCFTRLWHWLTNTTVDSIKVAEKIAQLAKKVQQAHPFKRGFERQLNKFAQGLSGNDSKNDRVWTLLSPMNQGFSTLMGCSVDDAGYVYFSREVE